MLRRGRGFATVAVLVLGLGIGAATAIFSAIEGVLLRPLPYVEPDRLVALWESNARANAERAGVSPPTLADWKDRDHTLGGLAAFRPWGFDWSGDGEPERLQGARVTANLFTLLGTRPRLGRNLVASDDDPGQPKVALVSEELWRRRFGGDPRVLGRTIALNGELHVIVGIVRQGFTLPRADVWVPVRFQPYELDQRGNRALTVIGRLKPGVGEAAARAELHGIALALQREFPASNTGWDARLSGLQAEIGRPVRTPLLLLLAAAAGLLLAACANFANLLLARSTARRREMAVRAALGASRARIVSQLVAENFVLVALAAALGLGLAWACARLLARAQFLPRSGEIGVDSVVVGFVLVLSLITAGGVALIPAIESGRVDLRRAFQDQVPHDRSRWGVALRDAPVIAQVALAFLLLVGGALLVRSFARAQQVRLGFAPSDALSMTVSLANSRYPTEAQRIAFFDGLRSRVAALHGVRGAGFASHPPLAGTGLSTDFTIEGRVPPHAETPSAKLVNVTQGYFEAMGIPVSRGRAFGPDDRAGNPKVLLVDETLARRFWPDGSAIGRRVSIGATLGADTAWREIVGIVGAVRSTSPEQEPEPTLYVPHAQQGWPTMTLVVRTEGAPERLERTVIGVLRSLDADQPVYGVRTLSQVLGRALGSRRLQALLMAGFAAAAFVLALIGVYGMLAYAVARRTRELGIRLALGAGREEIVRHCLARVVWPILAGLLLGAGTALVGARLVRALLFAVDPWDPATFLGVFAVVGTGSLLVSSVPALRASRLDPAMALRHD